jgi:hypothetical protein
MVRTGFMPGQLVRFAGAASVVRVVAERDGRGGCLVENGEARLPMWVPDSILQAHQQSDAGSTVFNRRAPHLLVVDDFYVDPDEIRSLALAQPYDRNPDHFKGVRSEQRFLWPGLREEFARLLGTPITEWLGHNANGVFQQTGHDDPLVWHHDTQSYAAAVYLTPNAPLGSGTSFWRDRTHGCRRRPSHPLETRRLGSESAVEAASGAVYDPYNIEHPDNWELVEAVGAVYNRLVIWDAGLIHSASSYEGFAGGGSSPGRLVQLFFFDA